MDQMGLRVLAVLVLLELHHFRDFHVHLLVQTIQLHQWARSSHWTVWSRRTGLTLLSGCTIGAVLS